MLPVPIKNPSGNHSNPVLEYYSKQVNWDPPVALVCTGPVEQFGLGIRPIYQFNSMTSITHHVNHY